MLAVLFLIREILLFILLPSLIAAVVYYSLISHRPRGFPPGPPTLPVLGNLHQLPADGRVFLQFQQWSKEYGSIIGLKFGSKNVVILNHHQHVKELFDKRGSLYSSRQQAHLTTTLIVPKDAHIIFVKYGPVWRAIRKTINGLLSVSVVDKLVPIQSAEASHTMHDLLSLSESTDTSVSKDINEDEGGYYNHIRRFGSAVVLASVFGQRAKSFFTPRVQDLFRVQDEFARIGEVGAAPPVDAFPFLRLVPGWILGGPWKEEARAVNKAQNALYYGLVEDTRQIKERRGESSGFMARLLDALDKGESVLTPEQIAYLGGALMEAGSDTTASTLLSFLLAIVKHPRVLLKCWEEVDSACGTRRSPSFEDISSLPYVRACMTETLRWRPVVPSGVPHTLTADDWYGDYFLPKDTLLFANTWAINHDEDQYEDAATFVPERWLDSNKFGIRKELRENTAAEGIVDKEATKTTNEGRRVTYSFGAGRRVCPGQAMAENSLMVMMAKLTWGFDIRSPLGSGEAIDTELASAYVQGFLTSPKPFPVTFKPRSEMHTRIIKEEFAVADGFLQQFEV